MQKNKKKKQQPKTKQQKNIKRPKSKQKKSPKKLKVQKRSVDGGGGGGGEPGYDQVSSEKTSEKTMTGEEDDGTFFLVGIFCLFVFV